MLAERIGSAQLAELAAQGASQAGTVRAGDLPRVAAVLAPDAGGELDVSLRFRTGPESHPVVEIRVSGELPLVCQRCLGSVPWPVELDVALTAVPDEAAADELADPFDSVLLDEEGGLRARSMVEDEILATMPLAPLHEASAGCRPAAVAAGAEPVAAPRVNRPFADLGTLMGGRGEGKK